MKFRSDYEFNSYNAVIKKKKTTKQTSNGAQNLLEKQQFIINQDVIKLLHMKIYSYLYLGKKLSLSLYVYVYIYVCLCGYGNTHI